MMKTHNFHEWKKSEYTRIDANTLTLTYGGHEWNVLFLGGLFMDFEQILQYNWTSHTFTSNPTETQTQPLTQFELPFPIGKVHHKFIRIHFHVLVVDLVFSTQHNLNCNRSNFTTKFSSILWFTFELPPKDSFCQISYQFRITNS